MGPPIQSELREGTLKSRATSTLQLLEVASICAKHGTPSAQLITCWKTTVQCLGQC